MQMQFIENQYPKLDEILSQVGSSISELNYNLDYKYGEYALPYFIKQIDETHDKQTVLFEDAVENLFNEIENPEKTKTILDFAELNKNELNDTVLQRTLVIKNELSSLIEIKDAVSELREKYKRHVDISNKLDSISPEYKLSNPEEERNLDKDIHFLKIELNDKNIILGRRSINYYENKEMYAQTGEVKESENISR